MTEKGMSRQPDELGRTLDEARGETREVLRGFRARRAAIELAGAMGKALDVIGPILAGHDEPTEMIANYDLVIDVGQRRVTRGGDAVPLTASQYELVLALARRPGRVCTYASLTEVLWPDSPPSPERARADIMEYMHRVRARIGADTVLTVGSSGYLFRETDPDAVARAALLRTTTIRERIPSPAREAFGEALSAHEEALAKVDQNLRGAIRALAAELAAMVEAISLATATRAERAAANDPGDPGAANALAFAIGAPERARHLTDQDPREAIVALARGLLGALRTGSHLRSLPKPGGTRVLGNVTIDLDDATVTRDGEVMHMTPLEFKILAVLTERPGDVYSKATLHERVGANQRSRDLDSIKPHITSLRRKLGDDLIRTEYGVGYASRPEGPRRA